jgi:hypothetical protein
MSEYVVILERADDGGWGAYLPDLPGVVAIGTTRKEVADRIGRPSMPMRRRWPISASAYPKPVATAKTIQAA